MSGTATRASQTTCIRPAAEGGGCRPLEAECGQKVVRSRGTATCAEGGGFRQGRGRHAESEDWQAQRGRWAVAREEADGEGGESRGVGKAVPLWGSRSQRADWPMRTAPRNETLSDLT